jgi:hypothetical protein
MRAVPRHNVQLPVRVTWREADAFRPSLNSLTRDISTRGMFIIADLEPSEGALLEFEIDMAEAEDTQTPLPIVRGAGRVVRTERPVNGRGGFAVHNLWFQLSEPEKWQELPFASSMQSVPSKAHLLNSRNLTPRRVTVVPRATTKYSNRF